MSSIIFTLVGPDKPGLVESVSKTVYALGGNWKASNFSHMAGHFAGFVNIDLPDDKHQELIERFAKHPDLLIQVVETDIEQPSAAQTVNIEVTGNDKAGIVQELTTVLHQFNINIVELKTQCSSAPNWGSSLFNATAVVEVQENVDISTLKEGLEDIANDLMVDITLES